MRVTSESTGNRSSGRIKVRDVAREAGVSVATVSRVTSGSPAVSPATRERILRIIKELGYAPDPFGKALNAGGTNTVGAVIPTVNHAIFAAFLESLEAELGRNGYSLVIATSENDRTVELARARSLLEMGAKALIVSGLDHEPELAELARRFGTPVVGTSLYNPAAEFPTIGYDNAGLARDAMQYLIGLGHANIALFHGPAAGNDRTRLRIKGAEGLGQGLALRNVETELSVKGGVRAVKRILTWKVPPTAILCLSDVLALGAMFELQRIGLRVPEDISVMGFDNISWTEQIHPPLTCMNLPVAEMGRLSASAICEYLSKGTPIESVQLSGELMPRRSTRPATRKSAAI